MESTVDMKSIFSQRPDPDYFFTGNITPDPLTTILLTPHRISSLNYY